MAKKNVARKKKAIRSAAKLITLDDFLGEEGNREEFEAIAVKEVLAWQIEQAMKEKNISRNNLAQRMKTSRSQIGRLLDPKDGNVTLATLQRAARMVGRSLRLELVLRGTRHIACHGRGPPAAQSEGRTNTEDACLDHGGERDYFGADRGLFGVPFKVLPAIAPSPASTNRGATALARRRTAVDFRATIRPISSAACARKVPPSAAPALLTSHQCGGRHAAAVPRRQAPPAR